MTKSTLLHLRIPFSYFLLPTFMMTAATVHEFDIVRFLLLFVIFHLFLYPASNGFNSYYDRDTGSIGGLKNPPEVKKELLTYSLLFDVFAIFLGLIISVEFATALFVYGLASKAYSWDSIRLKKRPLISWLSVGIFQGSFTVIMTVIALSHDWPTEILSAKTILLALLAGMFLLASYPMTQIYQHSEDKNRGDKTISIMLGIRGTFIMTAVLFIFTTLGFIIYFYRFYGARTSEIFLIFQSATVLYFLYWMVISFMNEKKADYGHTMRLNFISSTMMNLFSIYLIFGIH